ncbi:MAG TPA: NfeD family protein [Bacteroidales bacterium]|mgnify:CR=1 FL=1|nr:NfeD family protein [Bacteroidales bacterium]HOK74196.1 NfeD family protein [Bacteroidales bacterium]HOM39993.1 NfeD family protein [Bacteroidales bacterium]HOU29970.1 NfeD family protein [Bacteroidales bacterium]HPP92196.1 NfeD family protein [Bacteroidales bacterium]
MINFILSTPELLWFLLGLILFLLELILPGFVIFFFGVGAWTTAFVCLLFNPGVDIQILIFALTSVLSLVALRRMIQKKFFYGKNDNSHLIEDEFTGKEAITLSEIKPGKKGKVEFKGTVWTAESDTDIDEGETVIIISKDNFNLKVKPKNK